MRPQALLYAAMNPPMRALLRSPLHAFASRHLAILCYRGRKSGRPYETPLSFVRTGSTVRFLSSHNTRWWTNFRVGEAEPGVDVEVEIARERFAGKARLLSEDSQYFRDGVRSFLTALPRDAVIYGIKLDRNRKPRESDIEGAAGHVVLVEVELEA
jgi:hypothetical protein